MKGFTGVGAMDYEVVIVGAGPAGIFAALELVAAKKKMKPIRPR